jgi:glucose/arabinose dehydrogenase
MGRFLLVCLFAVTLSACGDDPLIIIGDLPGYMRVAAGTADSAGIRLDSVATRTKLTQPAGVAVASNGTLYVADQSTRLFSISSSGRLTMIYFAIGCLEVTCIRRPQGIALTPDESALLITDNQNNKLWRFTIASRTLSTMAGNGVAASSPDGTPAGQASLHGPTDVKVLADGRVLVVEREANKIRVISNDGILRTFAGTGADGQATDGAAALSSPLSLPAGIAVNATTVFVTETGSHTVRAIDLSNGTIRRLAGTGTAGFSGDGGPALAAALNFPWAVAVSGVNLFVVDQRNDRVRLINTQNGGISTFAGTGSKVYTGSGRAAAETSLNLPHGITVSSFGFLYVADYGHAVVWRTPILVAP